jgi:hypothetical protein
VTQPQVRVRPPSDADFGMGQCCSIRKRVRMKTLCCIVATTASLFAVPAMAQQFYGNGGGSTNIWSSAQGTSNSYGSATGFGNSSSGSMANAGGQGIRGVGGGGSTSAITTSSAGASSSGCGYAQTQTSATPTATFLDTVAGVVERLKTGPACILQGRQPSASKR